MKKKESVRERKREREKEVEDIDLFCSPSNASSFRESKEEKNVRKKQENNTQTNTFSTNTTMAPLEQRRRKTWVFQGPLFDHIVQYLSMAASKLSFFPPKGAPVRTSIGSRTVRAT